MKAVQAEPILLIKMVDYTKVERVLTRRLSEFERFTLMGGPKPLDTWACEAWK